MWGVGGDEKLKKNNKHTQKIKHYYTWMFGLIGSKVIRTGRRGSSSKDLSPSLTGARDFSDGRRD